MCFFILWILPLAGHSVNLVGEEPGDQSLPSQDFPSSLRPPAFGVRLPQCLKKNGTFSASRRSRIAWKDYGRCACAALGGLEGVVGGALRALSPWTARLSCNAFQKANHLCQGLLRVHVGGPVDGDEAVASLTTLVL